MNICVNNASDLSVQIALLKQQNSEQLAAVSDDLAVVKQQLAQLIQSIGTVNDTETATARSSAAYHSLNTSVLVQQLITDISVLAFQMIRSQY
jgi:hypothetical protein